MTARKKKVEPIDDPLDVHPMMVQVIQNNVLLHQVLDEVVKVKEKQDINHLVAVALRDHETIEHVDTMWKNFGNIKFLLRTVAITLGTVPLTATALGLTHFLWGWPR